MQQVESSQDAMLAALDRYGADLANWPEALRATAQDKAMRDSQFLAAFTEAQALQRLLRGLPEEPVPADLWGKLFAVPERYAQTSLAVLWSMLGRFGRVGSLAAFAGALMCGVMLGSLDASDSIDAFAAMDSFGLL